jgi:predicted ester cyclase
MVCLSIGFTVPAGPLKPNNILTHTAKKATDMPTTSDLNKSNTVRFFNLVFNEGNMDVIDELISPDYKFNGVATSAAGTKAWAEGLRAQFPDLHFSIEGIRAENDNVALRWRLRGTNPAGVNGHVIGTNILAFSGGQAISNDQGGGSEFVPTV